MDDDNGRDRPRGPAAYTPDWPKRVVAGAALVLLAGVGAYVWFDLLQQRDERESVAAPAAQTRSEPEPAPNVASAVPHSPANRYSVIAIAMVVVPLLMVLWKKLFGWDHAVLWIEGTLIVLFAAFWISQTQELWNDGIRQELPRSQATPSPLRSSAAE